MELALDTTEVTDRSDDSLPAKAFLRTGKQKLMTLAHLDGRTNAAKRAKQLVDDIAEDMGGGLTVSQRQLAQHAAILGAMLESMAANWLLGEKIDMANYALMINTQRRILAAL
jgi:hypothetical protein